MSRYTSTELQTKAMCCVRETSKFLLKITSEPLDVTESISFIEDVHAGGNFIFLGTTRKQEGHSQITG